MSAMKHQYFNLLQVSVSYMYPVSIRTCEVSKPLTKVYENPIQPHMRHRNKIGNYGWVILFMDDFKKIIRPILFLFIDGRNWIIIIMIYNFYFVFSNVLQICS